MSNLQITVEQGTLQGKIEKCDSGFQYKAFLGIPFAKPPINELRFRAAQPPEGWQGVRDATAEANVCSQFDVLLRKKYIGVEDCLYLNVHTPEDATADANLPVMVWIHGGAYSSGSGNADMYGPEYLLQQNVIVVTINYRLGPLGFICLHTPEVPGNAGMKDQVMALKWVQKNISKFGGDSQNITIFGESAGGSSVHHHVVSPLSKGLFHKAILQSGTTVNEWGINPNCPVNTAFKLAELLGFKTESKDELLNYLMKVPAEKLIMTTLSPELLNDINITFLPLVENNYPGVEPFITKNPRDLLEAGEFSRVPLMIGATSREGLLMVLMKPEFFKTDEKLTLEKVVPDFQTLIPKRCAERWSSEKKVEAAKKIKDFYFPTEENITDDYVKLMTDYSFVKDIDFTVKTSAKFVSPTYYYIFSFKGEINVIQFLMPVKYTGASHADELGYLFKPREGELFKDLKIEPKDRDILTIKRMSEMWTNFAKYGNPTPQLTENIKTIWKPITEDKVYCLDIDEELTLIEKPFHERVQFWRDLENL